MVKLSLVKNDGMILISEEERPTVKFVKNKNRCMQAVKKKELEKLILDVLHICDYTNQKLKGGRKFVKLSAYTRVALEKGRQVEYMFHYCQISFHGLVVDSI